MILFSYHFDEILVLSIWFDKKKKYFLGEDDSSSAPTQLNETIFQKDLLIKEVLEKVPAAIEHAKTLHDRSEDIDEQLYETRRTQAVRAVTAHQAILDAINNAVNDTMVADADNQNATRMVRCQNCKLIYNFTILQYHFCSVTLETLSSSSCRFTVWRIERTSWYFVWQLPNVNQRHKHLAK